MYDALVNKTVNSDEIQLSKPNLTITLAKPSSPKKEKKKNPIVFKNMMISNGNFAVSYTHLDVYKRQFDSWSLADN